MKYLLIKMRRDLAKMWTQFFSVFMMAFLGILIYVGMEGTWFGMKTELNSYIAKTNLASAWVYGNGITGNDLKKIKSTNGVTDATLAMTLPAKVKLPGDTGSKEPDLKLTSCTSIRISKPVTVSGTRYSATGSGIWLDKDFAKANKIKAGDRLVISVSDVTKSLVVKGLVISSEYMCYTGSNTASMPDHSKHGFAFIGSGTAQDIINETVAVKMQEKAIPRLSDKIFTAYNTAHKKADAEVERIFGSKISAQKSAAYISAAKAADTAVETAFGSAMSKQKTQAYRTAAKIADTKVETAFCKAVNLKKQQAYKVAGLQADAAAKQAVDQQFHSLFPTITDFSSFPQYIKALASAKLQAEEKAKALVEAKFASQRPQLAAKLAAAKIKGEQKARQLVDKKFTSMRPQLAAKLDAAKVKAEGKARRLVDQKFASMQSSLTQQLTKAKVSAESTAKTAATKAILKKCKLTVAQLDTVNKMAALPKISSLAVGKKADVSKQLVNLLKKMPKSMLSQNVGGFSLSTLKQTPVDYNMMRVKLESGYSTKGFEQKAQNILGSRYAGFADQNNLTPVSLPIQKTKQIEKMSIMFSAIFILLALLTMQTTMTRLVDTQRIQIGTMKALGFKDSQIRLHYASYGLTVGLLGGLLGLIIAPLTISPALLHSQSVMYTLPAWPVRLTPASYIMVAVITLCCTMATLFACRKGLVGMPAETMRGATPKGGRQVLLEKIPQLWKNVSFGWKWTIRDISRSKVRSIMGMVGVLGCMMLLIAGFGMQYTCGKTPAYTYKTQYTYSSKVVMLSSSTVENRNELAKIAGGGQWVQESPIEYRNSINNDNGLLSVVGDGSYVHLENAQGVAEKLPQNGVLVTQKTARILNLKKGSTVEFRISGKMSYIRATVSGITVLPSPQGIFVSQAAWKKLGKTFTPTSLLTGSTCVNSKISNLSYVEEVATRTNQYISSVNNLKTFTFIYLLLKMAAILLDVVILYNLGILSFTERTREYATLKVLGFYQKEIRSFALRENLATTIVGWLVGIPVGLWFLSAYVGALSTANIDMIPQLALPDFLIATVITVGCSICVNLFLSHRVKKIDMVEALKSIE